MPARILLRIGIGGIGVGGLGTYYYDEVKSSVVGAIRFGRTAKTVHKRSGEKLLDLCCVNGGAFIKVGQHVGSLDYLLPSEYVETLKILHSQAPTSNIEDVYRVIRQELKREPSTLFSSFSPHPIGSASLAQVHKATLKDGRDVAVKVQHPEVREHSKVDIKGMELLVNAVSAIFPDFSFPWLIKEMKQNLPLELDFHNEAKNAEKVARMFAHWDWLKIPSIHWPLTTGRVLTMEYCEGGQVDDRKYIRDSGVDRADVSTKLGLVYAHMVFVSGFVHCDPHPGNVLVRNGHNGASIVLLDHGLYTTLTEKFRVTYGELWLRILSADLKGIEHFSRELGLGQLYTLFTCMVTGRSWEAIEGGISNREITKGEREQIKDDASKYLPEIAQVLNRVPREMLLIFKTNDLLRGIEHALGTHKSMKSFVEMSRCCVKAVYAQRRKECSTTWCCVRIHVAESVARFRIGLYALYLWLAKMTFWNIGLGGRGCAAGPNVNLVAALPIEGSST